MSFLLCCIYLVYTRLSCLVCGSEMSVRVLQPEKQEDGTVTGKDRWRQKLLSAMSTGRTVTPPPFFPASYFLLPPLFHPVSFPSLLLQTAVSVPLFLSHPLLPLHNVSGISDFDNSFYLQSTVDLNAWLLIISFLLHISGPVFASLFILMRNKLKS